MEIMIINQQNIVSYNKEIQHIITNVVNNTAKLGRLPKNTEVSVLIVDNSYIQELNFIYRSQNKPTDVLSFAMNETVESEPDYNAGNEVNLLGDIV
ncbi:MAG: rRNA maturation RNase YbeY, partial [Syntrophomonadaceae bacterium]|nr:rRNA maturation RNase YbeY [Syntrophomonadaceae bacterium]